MLLEMIVSAAVPAVIDIIKSGAAKVFGGVKPLTVDDQIKLDQADIAKLEALAKLDAPGGTPSQWVIDLRASARYIGALAVIGVGIGSLFMTMIDPKVQAIALEASNIAFGFLFGSRIVAAFKK
jgi:hypothetical protein